MSVQIKVLYKVGQVKCHDREQTHFDFEPCIWPNSLVGRFFIVSETGEIVHVDRVKREGRRLIVSRGCLGTKAKTLMVGPSDLVEVEKMSVTIEKEKHCKNCEHWAKPGAEWFVAGVCENHSAKRATAAPIFTDPDDHCKNFEAKPEVVKVDQELYELLTQAAGALLVSRFGPNQDFDIKEELRKIFG